MATLYQRGRHVSWGHNVTDTGVEWSEAAEGTSPSLLVRVKLKDEDAWRRLVHLYGPLVYSWCRRSGLQEADAADVGQDVFRTVAESIERFRHDREGDSFRGWLRTITRTRMLDFLRRKARLVETLGGSAAHAELRELPACDADSGASNDDERLLLLRRAVDVVLGNCKEETRQAFLRVVVAGHHPADVAADLGMTSNAVYVAKSHILRRIRAEFAGLVGA